MPVIEDHPPFGLGIMPVMEVIEAQNARSWSLTITSITGMTGRLPRCSQHESPWRVRGPIPPQQRRSVPIAHEDRLVVADALATPIKLARSTSLLSAASPLP